MTSPASTVASPAPDRRSSGRRRGATFAGVFNVVPVGEVRRRPSDVSRLVAWGLLLVLLSVTADDRRPWGQTVANVVSAIPDAVQSVLSQVYRWGTFAVVVVAVATAVGRRRWRFAGALALTLAAVAAVGLALVDNVDVTTRQVGGSAPYPAVRLAFAVAVVVVSSPHVTRPLRQLLLVVVGVAAVGALTSGDALVVDALGAVALASALAAAVNLVLGSPAGLPSTDQVRDSLASRGVDVASLEPARSQVWGQTRFHVVDRDGRPLTAVVIGRDALDARLLTKLWRSIWYRDAGGSISFTRIGQVEHHAFVLLLAHERGVPVPELVTAGMGGTRDDAVLVLTRPPGTRLADLAPPPPPRPDDDGDGDGDGDHEPPPPPPVPYLTEDELPDATLARAWTALHRLHGAGLAHGRVDGRTVHLAPDGAVTLAEVDRASADAPRSRQDLDDVGLLVATAEVVGNARALDAARAALGDDHLARLLPMLSTAALPGVESGRRSWTRQRCKDLRTEGAALLGIDVPEPEELRRVTPTEIVLTVGTLIGVYLLLGQLADLTSVWSTFQSAQIGWVVLAAFATQVPTVAAGVAMIGTVAEQELPLRQTTVIQYSNKFTGLVGGTLAGIAVFTRYLQKRGLGVAVAASSAALTSVAQGFVQAVLFLIALLVTRGDFSGRIGGSGSGGSIDLGTVLLVILAAAVVIGVVLGVPKLRKAIRRVVRPQWETAKGNFEGVIATPRRAALLLGGNLVAQLFFAIGLKLALLAYGYDLPLLDFVVINTVASLLGGIAPVPGGMGVIEAGLIAGLTAAGVPDDAALAATFTYRAFTAYLPPIAGWAALSWLRRTELI